MLRQKPTDGRITSRSEALAIASHPAIRLGFLDAQRGLGIDHDDIMARIEAETPPLAIKRIGWTVRLRYPTPDDVRLAQYRYEEGRLLVLQEGLRCRTRSSP